MSKKTLEFHYGKHHRAYVDNLNKQIQDTDFERNTLEEVIKISYNNGNPLAPFNNAGQVRLYSSYLHIVVQSLYFLLALEAVSGTIALRILRGGILVLFDSQKSSCWVRDVLSQLCSHSYRHGTMISFGLPYVLVEVARLKARCWHWLRETLVLMKNLRKNSSRLVQLNLEPVGSG